MSERIDFDTVKGQKVIGTGALGYCNTKYHRPYLAVVRAGEEMDWQEKLYEGYGKHQSVYYSVADLLAGDLIKAAGGSGGNKYPHKARVLEIFDDHMIVETLSDKAFGNAVAALVEVEEVNPLADFETAQLLAELERRGVQ